MPNLQHLATIRKACDLKTEPNERNQKLRAVIDAYSEEVKDEKNIDSQYLSYWKSNGLTDAFISEIRRFVTFLEESESLLKTLEQTNNNKLDEVTKLKRTCSLEKPDDKSESTFDYKEMSNVNLQKNILKILEKDLTENHAKILNRLNLMAKGISDEKTQQIAKNYLDNTFTQRLETCEESLVQTIQSEKSYLEDLKKRVTVNYLIDPTARLQQAADELFSACQQVKKFSTRIENLELDLTRLEDPDIYSSMKYKLEVLRDKIQDTKTHEEIENIFKYDKEHLGSTPKKYLEIVEKCTSGFSFTVRGRKEQIKEQLNLQMKLLDETIQPLKLAYQLVYDTNGIGRNHQQIQATLDLVIASELEAQENLEKVNKEYTDAVKFINKKLEAEVPLKQPSIVLPSGNIEIEALPEINLIMQYLGTLKKQLIKLRKKIANSSGNKLDDLLEGEKLLGILNDIIIAVILRNQDMNTLTQNITVVKQTAETTAESLSQLNAFQGSFFSIRKSNKAAIHKDLINLAQQLSKYSL